MVLNVTLNHSTAEIVEAGFLTIICLVTFSLQFRNVNFVAKGTC